jgi:hypothetical protein
MNSLEPLIVDVKTARKMLGSMSNNKFWGVVRDGHLELVGSPRKRYVVVQSIRNYVDRMPRRQVVEAPLREPAIPMIPPPAHAPIGHNGGPAVESPSVTTGKGRGRKAVRA